MCPVVSKLDLAYLAGVLDSDGSISIIRIGASKGRPTDWAITVSVSQVTLGAIGHFHKLFGGGLTCGRHYALWRWQVSYVKAVDVLRLVEPYLRIKREAAGLAIAFHEARQKSMRRSKLTEADVQFREDAAAAVRAANELVGRVKPSSIHVPSR